MKEGERKLAEVGLGAVGGQNNAWASGGEGDQSGEVKVLGFFQHRNVRGGWSKRVGG